MEEWQCVPNSSNKSHITSNNMIKYAIFLQEATAEDEGEFDDEEQEQEYN